MDWYICNPTEQDNCQLTKPSKIRFHPFFLAHWPWSHRRLQEQRQGRRRRWGSQRGKSQGGRALPFRIQRKPPSFRYPRAQYLSKWFDYTAMVVLVIMVTLTIVETLPKMKAWCRPTSSVLEMADIGPGDFVNSSLYWRLCLLQWFTVQSVAVVNHHC